MVAIAPKEITEQVPYVLEVDGVIVESGVGRVDGSLPGCICYDDKAQMLAAHPELQAIEAQDAVNIQKRDIDKTAGVDIAKAHLAKAQEAALIIFDLVTTPPERFPHLYPESQAKNITLEALADIVWAKHVEDAGRDNQRIISKEAI